MSQSVTNPRRLLPLIMTVTGMGVLAFAIIAPALPDLADELGVSRGAIGLVQGAVAIPGIFLAAYIGYLADRLGRRRVIRISLVIFGTFGLACFFARDYRLLGHRAEFRRGQKLRAKLAAHVFVGRLGKIGRAHV